MFQWGGQVVIRMLENVQQATIKPLNEHTIEMGSLIYTDEYSVYARSTEWGDGLKTVNHSQGE